MTYNFNDADQREAAMAAKRAECCEEIEELRQQLSEYVDCVRWRDVSTDGLPTEAQEVLFARGKETLHGAFIGGLFWHSNKQCAALYWMPLPKPPKALTTTKPKEQGK